MVRTPDRKCANTNFAIMKQKTTFTAHRIRLPLGQLVRALARHTAASSLWSHYQSFSSHQRIESVVNRIIGVRVCELRIHRKKRNRQKEERSKKKTSLRRHAHSYVGFCHAIFSLSGFRLHFNFVRTAINAMAERLCCCCCCCRLHSQPICHPRR